MIIKQARTDTTQNETSDNNLDFTKLSGTVN